jgi:hypothetical protein
MALRCGRIAIISLLLRQASERARVWLSTLSPLINDSNLVNGTLLCRDGFKVVLESNKLVSKSGQFIGKGYDCGGLFRFSLLDLIPNITIVKGSK